MAENDRSIVCAKCGEANRSEARFCLKCGADLASPITDQEAVPDVQVMIDEGNDTVGLAIEKSTQTEVEQVVEDEVPEVDNHFGEKLSQPDMIKVESDAAVDPDILDEKDQHELLLKVEPTPKASSHFPILQPGDILHERYRIIERIGTEETGIIQYSAHDLKQCTQCQSQFETWPEDDFCPACGIVLTSHLVIEIEQLLTETAEDFLPDDNSQIYFEEDRIIYIVSMPEPAGEPEKDGLSAGIRLRYGFQSDVGELREIDEDSILTMSLTGMFEGICETTLGLFAIADGIGGHDAGEIASRKAIQQLSTTVLDGVFKRIIRSGRAIDLDWLEVRLRQAVLAANEDVFKCHERADIDLGTTITAVLINNELAAIANVGDSRTYLWRDGVLQQITEDHSMIASLIAANQLESDAIYTHEQKGVIYRSLGDSLDLKVDTFSLELKRGDRLILCCDGVWEMIRDDGIEQVMLEEPDPQRACDEMVKRSNWAGGDDNISVVVVVVDSA